MYNTKFATFEEAMKLNNLTKELVISHLQSFYENQNYRSNYNRTKTQLTNALRNDPVVKERMAQLKSKLAK